MISDAFRAELFKLWRDRTLVLWCVLAPALVHLVIGMMLELLVRGSVNGAAALARPNIALESVLAVGAPANPIVAGFLVAAACVVIAGEYRWATWRLIAPRNDRGAILVGKYGALSSFVAVAASLFAVNGVLIGYLSAFVNGVPPEEIAGGAVSGASAVFLGMASALIHGAFVIGVVATVAIATRSLLVCALAAAIGLIVLEGGVALLAQDYPRVAALTPIGAAAELRQHARMLAGDEDAAGSGDVWGALAVQAAWALALFGIAWASVRRQEFPRE